MKKTTPLHLRVMEVEQAADAINTWMGDIQTYFVKQDIAWRPSNSNETMSMVTPRELIDQPGGHVVDAKGDMVHGSVASDMFGYEFTLMGDYDISSSTLIQMRLQEGVVDPTGKETFLGNVGWEKTELVELRSLVNGGATLTYGKGDDRLTVNVDDDGTLTAVTRGEPHSTQGYARKMVLSAPYEEGEGFLQIIGRIDATDETVREYAVDVREARNLLTQIGAATDIAPRRENEFPLSKARKGMDLSNVIENMGRKGPVIGGHAYEGLGTIELRYE